MIRTILHNLDRARKYRHSNTYTQYIHRHGYITNKHWHRIHKKVRNARKVFADLIKFRIFVLLFVNFIHITWQRHNSVDTWYTYTDQPLLHSFIADILFQKFRILANWQPENYHIYNYGNCSSPQNQNVNVHHKNIHWCI